MNPAPPNMHYVYFLKSLSSNFIYIGCTSDLEKRLQQHNNGGSHTTKKYLPMKLVYFEAYLSKDDAYERERKLKYYGSGLQNVKQRMQKSLI